MASTISIPAFDESAEAFGAIPTDGRIMEILNAMFDPEVIADVTPLERLQAIKEYAVNVQSETYGEVLEKVAQFVSNGSKPEDTTPLFHTISRYGEWRMLSMVIGATMIVFMNQVETQGRA